MTSQSTKTMVSALDDDLEEAMAFPADAESHKYFSPSYQKSGEDRFGIIVNRALFLLQSGDAIPR